MAYLYFESFVVSMKGTAKRLEELSVLMTVKNLLFGYLPRRSQLLHIRNHLCLSALCTVAFLQVGWGGVDLRCTWATVMAHFFASSSLASSLG